MIHHCKSYEHQDQNKVYIIQVKVHIKNLAEKPQPFHNKIIILHAAKLMEVFYHTGGSLLIQQDDGLLLS